MITTYVWTKLFQYYTWNKNCKYPYKVHVLFNFFYCRILTSAITPHAPDLLVLQYVLNIAYQISDGDFTRSGQDESEEVMTLSNLCTQYFAEGVYFAFGPYITSHNEAQQLSQFLNISWQNSQRLEIIVSICFQDKIAELIQQKLWILK